MKLIIEDTLEHWLDDIVVEPGEMYEEEDVADSIVAAISESIVYDHKLLPISKLSMMAAEYVRDHSPIAFDVDLFKVTVEVEVENTLKECLDRMDTYLSAKKG